MNLSCVILAAGLGKRMKSGLPKVLHRVCGVPMLQAVVNAVRELNPYKIVVVVGTRGELIKKTLNDDGLVYAAQKEAKGTGHALRCAISELGDFRGTIIVVNGDTPLLRAGTIRKFTGLHKKEGNAVSVLSFETGNPDDYGRIVRDASGRLAAIVEHKDADLVQMKITEVNSGVYAINHDAVSLLNRIRMNPLKGEYYLTDIVAEALKRGFKVSAYCMGLGEEFMGVNTREELLRASMLMKKEMVSRWINKGVTFLDADSVYIHPDVRIGRDTTIYPNVYLEGRTRVGSHSVIYPNVRIQDSSIGNRAVIKDSTIIEESVVKDGASVGPFARIRPGSVVGSDARIGNFVEIKKSAIGKGTKAAHLSYIGDAVIGKEVNIGAGTITCNYDGRKKHKTEINDGVFVGSDTQLVAPVSIGRGAYIGAGSTITEDVPPLSLAVSRTKQTNVEDWARKRQSRVKSKRLKAKGTDKK
jgi:bifunctional UDP-N-acetylglucosamine pyrophosphorylase/glucosamine-1-phosphate N-acetyltransferase